MPYAERSTTDDLIIVQTTWNEKELIKSVPGSRWHSDTRVWSVPLTFPACSQLKGIFGDALTVGPTLTQWIWSEYEARVRPSMALRELTHDPNGGIHIDVRLYDFQQVGAAWLVTAGSALLGDEMGTGKTIQVLAAMKAIGNDALPALIVCPNSVKVNWAKEVKIWHPNAHAYVLDGSALVKTKMIQQAMTDPHALVIINYESTHRLSRVAGYGSMRLARCRECDKNYGNPSLKASSCEVHPRALNRVPFRTVVVDEAHRIKDPKAKQTRAIWALGDAPTVERRWALTGTPLATDPSDVWSIMRFVAPPEYPTKSKFVDRYALHAWNDYGGLNVVGLNPQTKDEFYKIFDPRFRCMPKALVLDQLPPKIRQQRFVTMSPKQKKAYDELAKKLVTKLDDGSVLVARSNLSAQIRLLQLSSSYAKIDVGSDPSDLSQWSVELCEPSPKLDELMAVLDELGDKSCVVASEHRRLIELAVKRLEKAKISYGLITGAVDAYERQIALDDFQAGRLRVLLFTLKAGGTGLTMTRSDTIVFLQRSWSMIDNKQAEDRVHRIGSEIHDSVNIIDIITQDTVEETQLLRLNDKMLRLEEITRTRETLRRANESFAHLDVEERKILNSYLGEPDSKLSEAELVADSDAFYAEELTRG